MAAPSGTVWGSTVNSYGRIGIYAGVSSSGSTSTVTVSTWFWSKYSVSDTSNSYYYNRGATSATNLIGSVDISTTVSSGSGWSTSNQVQLKATSYTYTRGTSAQTVDLAAKLTGIERVGGTMTATTSFTIPKLDSYTVSYNANGGSGAPSSQTKWYGKTLTLSSTKPTRTGYTFAGWATSSSGSVAYAAGASYTANAAVTLYAKWTAVTYTVSYNANGGSGAPSSQTKTYGVTLTLSSTKPTRTNYTFKGWATSASGSVVYAAGASYTANAAVTLYAVWELNYTLPVISGLKAVRCDSSGTEDEAEGLYAKVTFSWSTCQVSGNTATLSKCTVVCNGVTTSVTASGSSGSVSQVVGAGALSVESSYGITVTLTDSKSGVTSKTVNLTTAKFIVDFKSGGTGMAIGKVAETDNLLDVALPAKFAYPITSTYSNDLAFTHTHPTTGYEVHMGVGAGGYNRGVFDATKDSWLIYDGSNTDYTYIPSTYLSLGGRGNYLGYVISASATSVSTTSGTAKSVTSLSLPAGAWVVVGNVYFPSTTVSGSAYAMVNLGTSSSIDSYTGANSRFVSMYGRIWGNIEMTRVLSISSSARTVYLNARQDSGSSIAVNGYIYAIKIA